MSQLLEGVPLTAFFFWSNQDAGEDGNVSLKPEKMNDD